MRKYKSLMLGGLILCFSAATCFAGFINNPTVPRLKPVTEGEFGDSLFPYGEDHYAMAATVNPGTFVVTAEFKDVNSTFFTTPGNFPTRRNDKLTVRAYCYETNTSVSMTLSTWEQGMGTTVVNGGLPFDYHEIGSACPNSAHIPFFAYTKEFMKIGKVDITKDALPPAPGQTYGRLYASVSLNVLPGPDNERERFQESLLYAFEISRNASGQPTINGVKRPYSSAGWEPSECVNTYASCPANYQNLAAGTYRHYYYPQHTGLVRHAIGKGCNVGVSKILSHTVSVNKRPGPSGGYEAWLWWYQYIHTDETPTDTHRARIFGYRLDTFSQDTWAVLKPTELRPDAAMNQATMDSCFDQVGNKIWFQISTAEGKPGEFPGYTSLTAGWLPSDFAAQSTEDSFYTANSMDFSTTACIPFGHEDPLNTDPNGVGGLAYGTIDSILISGTQSRVHGVFSLPGGYVQAYRATNGALSTLPTELYHYSFELPDITSFGNPFATSQYGRSGNNALSNPHGAVIASIYDIESRRDISTSLWENYEEDDLTKNSLTKGIFLSSNQNGFNYSSVDLTSDNHWIKVSQVKKRLDQSTTSTARDRELFYTWLGRNTSGSAVLAIKRSAPQAFKYGVNYSQEAYQWLDTAGIPAFRVPGDLGNGSLFCGVNGWGNNRYNHGAIAGFWDSSLSGFSSGDQLFDSILEVKVLTAYDNVNKRTVTMGGNELDGSTVRVSLIDNPTDPNDYGPALFNEFFSQGVTGFVSLNVTGVYNFFGLRPWGYNYFRYYVDNNNGVNPGGAAIREDAKIWSYWIDWQ